MIYSEIARQLQLFVQAVIVGAVLIFVYDLLRVFRRVVKHRVIGIAVQDMLFWMLCALGLFAFMYRQNDGIIRGFLILGAFCGMLFYRILFSRWVVKGGTAMLRCVFRAIGRFFYVVSAPVRFFAGIMGRRMQKNVCRKKKMVRYMKKRLKKLGKAVRIGFSKL
ncbi:MAG: spore cortex biosynthesis protein YabQ [Clostridiales bacterium]|nr:spore cortex biosynthesis protein YabQ [Clostridiales bacterium]